MTALKHVGLILAGIACLAAYILFMPALVVGVILVMMGYALAGVPGFLRRLPAILGDRIDRYNRAGIYAPRVYKPRR